MTDFIIKKLLYDLTSNAGLALVGQYTKRLEISASVDRKFPVQKWVSSEQVIPIPHMTTYRNTGSDSKIIFAVVGHEKWK